MFSNGYNLSIVRTRCVDSRCLLIRLCFVQKLDCGPLIPDDWVARSFRVRPRSVLSSTRSIVFPARYVIRARRRNNEKTPVRRDNYTGPEPVEDESGEREPSADDNTCPVEEAPNAFSYSEQTQNTWYCLFLSISH